MIVSDSAIALPVAIVAVRTGISDRTLRRLARAGKLPGARKIGRSWRIVWSVLLDWLKGNPEAKA